MMHDIADAWKKYVPLSSDHEVC